MGSLHGHRRKLLQNKAGGNCRNTAFIKGSGKQDFFRTESCGIHPDDNTGKMGRDRKSVQTGSGNKTVIRKGEGVIMDIISGGISGAVSDPLSPEAQEHAILYYEEIRHRTDDIIKISKYTGYTGTGAKSKKLLIYGNSCFINRD